MFCVSGSRSSKVAGSKVSGTAPSLPATSTALRSTTAAAFEVAASGGVELSLQTNMVTFKIKIEYQFVSQLALLISSLDYRLLDFPTVGQQVSRLKSNRSRKQNQNRWSRSCLLKVAKKVLCADNKVIESGPLHLLSLFGHGSHDSEVDLTLYKNCS